MQIKAAKRLAVIGLTALGVYMLSALGVYERLEAALNERIEAGRMLNVTYTDTATPAPAAPAIALETGQPSPAPTPGPDPAPVPETPRPSPETLSVVLDSGAEEALETTIQGGLSIKNETDYSPDINAILANGPQLSLPAEGPQILIIHTHGSEAYTQVPGEEYEESDAFRTEDREKNIIAVGDRLTEIFTECGLNVLHDRGIYDYPSYTGSYTRSGEAVESYLADYPSIKIVIDVHRDALGSGDVIYKTEAAIAGKSSSQVMLLVGTGENGLPHPYWKENLKLAMYMQKAMDDNYPTLARPIALKSERYNQHLTQGSMILEVGSSGNTLSEAMCAIELFGQSVGEALAQLVE